MLYLTSFRRRIALFTRSLFTHLSFLILILTFPSFAAEPHPLSEDSLSKGLPDKLAIDWRATGPSHKLIAEKIPETPESKLLVEYGLQSITDRQYSNGKARITIEAFEMKYASGAYGLWTFHRGSLGATQREIFNGRFVLRFSGPDESIVEAVAAQMKTNLTSTSESPLLPTYLPDQSKIANSEKYLIGPEAVARVSAISDLKNVIDFTGGTHAAIADYNNGNGKMSIVLVEFQSPQFAVDGLAKIQSHFSSLSPDEQKKRILRRVGNYALEAVNVSDPETAQEVLKQVKYMVSVHWEGKNASAIPIPFRPPDPSALREVVQTGQFLVATFYWIGILVVGAVVIGISVGGVIFYWRRAQRRKLGMADGFTDAGGMTRLNLDDYLLTGPDTSPKMLGKGE
jgi:hypothetical protein